MRYDVLRKERIQSVDCRNVEKERCSVPQLELRKMNLFVTGDIDEKQSINRRNRGSGNERNAVSRSSAYRRHSTHASTRITQKSKYPREYFSPGRQIIVRLTTDQTGLTRLRVHGADWNLIEQLDKGELGEWNI